MTAVRFYSLALFTDSWKDNGSVWTVADIPKMAQEFTGGLQSTLNLLTVRTMHQRIGCIYQKDQMRNRQVTEYEG